MSQIRTIGRGRLAAAGAAIAASAACAMPAGAAGMSILYDRDPAVRAIVTPTDGQRGLSPERGAHRQEKSGGHLFYGPADAAYRVAKVNAKELADLSAAQIASRLKLAIDHGCGAFGCASHLVSVNEAGASMSDGRPPKVPPRRFASRAAARAAGPPVVRLPPVDRDSLGARFSRAMAMLDTRSPYGGTYASRVHVYIAPAMSTAIAVGRGPHHNLGRDGKPHFTTWRAVMPGLARAGGLWLEMYHGSPGSGTSAMTAAEWRTVAPRFLSVSSRYGGRWDQLHFVFTGGTALPAGAPAACGPTAMTCSWTLASSTAANRRVLANGPGAYAVGAAASEWLANFNARFP